MLYELESLGLEVHSAFAGMIHLGNEKQRYNDHCREKSGNHVLRKRAGRGEKTGECDAYKPTTQQEGSYYRRNRVLF